jgi:hypothetical protein
MLNDQRIQEIKERAGRWSKSWWMGLFGLIFMYFSWWAGIVLAVLWHWWAFPIGVAMSYLVFEKLILEEKQHGNL